jgi:serine/threonine protein kinase
LATNGRFSRDEVLEVGRQMLTALHDLHEAGIVHNDVKPSNILTGRELGDSAYYLTDFGIATELDKPQTRRT